MLRGSGCRTIVGTAVAAAALSGCGGADSDSPANVRASPKATVVLTGGAYRPDRVRISVGERVTFVNGSERANTAETDDVGFFELDREDLDRRNEFDVHTLQSGEAESVEFDTAGTYRFHSSLNERMKGTVEVVEPAR